MSQIIGVGANGRKHFSLGDTERDVPVGTEYQVAHVRYEDRRLHLWECPSHDHVHLQDLRLAILGRVEGEQAKLRDVDDDGGSVEYGQPAPALERELDLSDPGRKGRRALLIGGGSGGAGRQQAVTRQGLLEKLIVQELGLDRRNDSLDIVSG